MTPLTEKKVYSDKMPVQKYVDEIEGSHGKIEQRFITTLPLSSVVHAINSHDWIGIKNIVMIERVAEYKTDEITS